MNGGRAEQDGTAPNSWTDLHWSRSTSRFFEIRWRSPFEFRFISSIRVSRSTTFIQPAKFYLLAGIGDRFICRPLSRRRDHSQQF